VADKSDPKDAVRKIASNRKARFDYQVDEEVEAGLVLRGTEVKSLRNGKVQLYDAYARISDGEAQLHQMHIPE